MSRRQPKRSVAGAVILLGTVVLVLVIGASFLVLRSPLPELSQEIAARTPDLDHGAYLAAVGDCTACHTTPGGRAFAGGLAFPTPVGLVYSANITPDRSTGIGNYTLPEFMRLMRQGVGRNGRRIYPAMPYTAFAKVSDADLQDLFGYFMHAVAPVAEANRRGTAVWPLSIRWPLAFWDRAFLDTTRFSPDPARTAEWNRGAYLVEGLGHCGTCHTPRGIGFQEKATTDDNNMYLAGAELDGQSASNLRGNQWAGLGRWSPAAIVELLKTARTDRYAVAGQMTEVVIHSTQHMTDDDLRAIAAYLKSLSAAPPSGSGFAASDASYNEFMAGQATGYGARIYMDSCAACHRLDGQGYDHTFPALAGNATVLHPNPASLVTAILAGARLPSTAAAPSPLAMPAFGWRYSDQEVAALASYVRAAWGNQAAPTTETQVRKIRAMAEDRARQR